MKKIVSVIAALFVIVSASAYSPVIGGESLFDLSSPFGLSYGGSVVGGGISSISPSSITVNPALTAREQRVGLNVAYSALFATGDYKAFGSTFQSGIMIPFNWAVVTGYINATFPGDVFWFGNSINIKGSLSKEITNHLSVGLGVNSGFTFGNVADWSLSGNLGFVYDIPELGFMKDFRFGLSILNLGKNYKSYEYSEFLECYPGFMMVKAGAGTILFANDTIKVGASFDVSTPFFTNVIFDTGCQLTIKDMLTISVSEKINVWELSQGVKSLIPSIGIFFRFGFNVKNNEYLDSHEWGKSEMNVGAAYKNLYQNVHAVSASADLLLGQKDEDAPVIKLWEDE